jgi:hypothetical protein
MLWYVRPRDTRRLLAGTALAGLLIVVTSAGSARGDPQQRIPLFPAARAAATQLGAFRSHIQHIVFIIKENRSFDMYFGAFPGADGATSAVISTGERVSLRHATDRMPRDVGHDWEDARTAMHGGEMDRFDLIRGNQRNDMLSLTQFLRSDIPNYWATPSTLRSAIGCFLRSPDRAFRIIYTVAAQSGGAINNPNSFNWGCDADERTRVDVLNATGEFSRQYPCFDMPTVTDRLEAAAFHGSTTRRSRPARLHLVGARRGAARALQPAMAGPGRLRQ